MTLTAREALQALLDGKTLRKDEVTIIPTEWGFRMQADDGVYKDIILRDCEVVEDDMEYPLTFEQALLEMLNGKTVMCEKRPDLMYRFHNGTFENCDRIRYEKGESCAMFIPEQKAKWRVVE